MLVLFFRVQETRALTRIRFRDVSSLTAAVPVLEMESLFRLKRLGSVSTRFSAFPVSETFRGRGTPPPRRFRASEVDDDTRKLPKLDDNTADYIRSGLTPRWSDLDVNQHVNNVKYVGWILESAPLPILETHELAGMTLEYRRECMRDSVLQSLTSVVDKDKGVGGLANGIVECQHLLRLEGGGEIVKGRTLWRSKYGGMIGRFGQLPEDVS